MDLRWAAAMQRIRSAVAAGRRAGGRGRGPAAWGQGLALALALLLFLAVGVPPLEALSIPLPWGSGGGDASGASSPSPAGRLQEVAPPPAVRQLRSLLAERDPQLEILSPRPDATLPPGPWTLRLQLRDWPLVELEDLGLGPHLVVQLDDDPPLRLTSLERSMPSLTPGSHRLTVYAAHPWGEAVRSPGARRQISIHRAAVNPLALPAPGTPQLILASPTGLWAQEPLLIDWLLLDAPLQNLRSEGADWRLRISVSGDSFLVDRQTPLWLRGWPRGRSGVLLELVDGRGDPINPPFNSVVTEVDRTVSGPAPVWLGSRLDPEQTDRLLGRVREDLPRREEPQEVHPGGPEIPAGEPAAPAPLPADGGDQATVRTPAAEDTTAIPAEPLAAPESPEPESTAPESAGRVDAMEAPTPVIGAEAERPDQALPQEEPGEAPGEAVEPGAP